MLRTSSTCSVLPDNPFPIAVDSVALHYLVELITLDIDLNWLVRLISSTIKKLITLHIPYHDLVKIIG